MLQYFHDRRYVAQKKAIDGKKHFQQFYKLEHVAIVMEARKTNGNIFVVVNGPKLRHTITRRYIVQTME
ncbi:hypothetical protein KIN20_012660 [Parelaphostrongylus tenuis]|uniref:Uncharacterized protein n=1 Tax=Parelaphostrongylus tenuis TaxID=148309 RepID=A0AAD5QQL0_PARTN|nr:hypothetical protein KIN20_012660 [Parelaphostrongylus tenuis]